MMFFVSQEKVLTFCSRSSLIFRSMAFDFVFLFNFSLYPLLIVMQMPQSNSKGYVH